MRRGERRLRASAVGLSGDLLGEFASRAAAAAGLFENAPPTLLLAAFCSARNESAVGYGPAGGVGRQQGIYWRRVLAAALGCDGVPRQGFHGSFRSITAARLLAPSPGWRRRTIHRDEAIHVRRCNIVRPRRPCQMGGCWTRPSRTRRSRRPASPARESGWPLPGLGDHAPCASATRRALLLTALGGLLIAGLVTTIPTVVRARRLVGPSPAIRCPALAPRWRLRSTVVSGDCLMWRTAPDLPPSSCRRAPFEIASPLTCTAFPGMEYGQKRCSPSPVRIQQIGEEQCEAAVRRYLGTVRSQQQFTISILVAGDRAWRQAHALWQSPGRVTTAQPSGAGRRHRPVQGLAGRYLPGHRCHRNQPIVPVDCAAPHAMGIRHGQPGREVSDALLERTRSRTGSSRTRAPDDGRLPRAPQVTT